MGMRFFLGLIAVGALLILSGCAKTPKPGIRASTPADYPAEISVPIRGGGVGTAFPVEQITKVTDNGDGTLTLVGERWFQAEPLVLVERDGREFAQYPQQFYNYRGAPINAPIGFTKTVEKPESDIYVWAYGSYYDYGHKGHRRGRYDRHRHGHGYGHTRPRR